MKEEIDESGYGSKKFAHEMAQERSLTNHFAEGEQITVLIHKPPEKNGGEQAVAFYSRGEVNDVRVFVDPPTVGEHRLHQGSRVQCRIRHIGGTYLNAQALCRLD